jgi:prepilin-type processing-associated H-X9-DG protein
MYCPSRRPVQTYPQQTILNFGGSSGDSALFTTAMGVAAPGQALMIYDSSTTTLSASLATGLTSDAHSDYAGNGFTFSDYPTGNKAALNFMLNLLGMGGGGGGTYYAAGFLSNPTTAESMKAALASTPAGQGGIFFYALTTTMAQISDGTSNTYLCGEKYIDANHYLDGLDGTPGGDSDCICDYNGYDADMVRMVGADDLPAHGWPPRQDMPGLSSLNMFGSAHAGMCNMAFCDGSVHQISYGIAAIIHWELGNRADGNAIDASMY